MAGSSPAMTLLFDTVPVLRSSAWQELRHNASKTRVNALMASRPGHKCFMPQKENPRGERAFSVVNLGSWGLDYPRGDFGGLVKSRVNSVKLLAQHRGVGVGHRDRSTGLD